MNDKLRATCGRRIAETLKMSEGQVRYPVFENSGHNKIIIERFGQLFLYELDVKDFCISYHEIDTAAEVTLEKHNGDAGPEILIALTDCDFSIDGLGNRKLRPLEICLRYNPNQSIRIKLRRKTCTRYIVIQISRPYFRRLIGLSSELTELIPFMKNRKAFLVPGNSGPTADYAIDQDITNILQCQFSDGIRDIYAQAIGKSLILRSLKLLVGTKGKIHLPEKSLN
jgi:hypothetical protein